MFGTELIDAGEKWLKSNRNGSVIFEFNPEESQFICTILHDTDPQIEGQGQSLKDSLKDALKKGNIK